MLSNRGSFECRGCGMKLGQTILNLGSQPLSNELLPKNFSREVPVWPLEFKICSNCQLGQIGEFATPDEIFSEYTYFSSASTSWLEHASRFALYCLSEFKLKPEDLILEIASNDGYLLKIFNSHGIQTLGIEPAVNVAKFAMAEGVETITEFFGEALALHLVSIGRIPRIVVANNVLAHVPDLIDFLKGLSVLAKHGAVISIEAPSMLTMLTMGYFDTIYHEHFSYLSATTVDFLAKNNGLKLFNIEILETHGGSYRYWLGDLNYEPRPVVAETIHYEEVSGISSRQLHQNFANQANLTIANFRDWVKTIPGPILGYGAAAKATVLLNSAQISKDEIIAVGDNGMAKQDKLIPGCSIEIKSPMDIFCNCNYPVVLFPWNIADELACDLRKNYPGFAGEIWKAVPNMVLL